MVTPVLSCTPCLLSSPQGPWRCHQDQLCTVPDQWVSPPSPHCPRVLCLPCLHPAPSWMKEKLFGLGSKAPSIRAQPAGPCPHSPAQGVLRPWCGRRHSRLIPREPKTHSCESLKLLFQTQLQPLAKVQTLTCFFRCLCSVPLPPWCRIHCHLLNPIACHGPQLGPPCPALRPVIPVSPTPAPRRRKPWARAVSLHLRLPKTWKRGLCLQTCRQWVPSGDGDSGPAPLRT